MTGVELAVRDESENQFKVLRLDSWTLKFGEEKVVEVIVEEKERASCRCRSGRWTRTRGHCARSTLFSTCRCRWLFHNSRCRHRMEPQQNTQCDTLCDVEMSIKYCSMDGDARDG